MRRILTLFALFRVSKDFTEKLQKKSFPNTSVYFLALSLLNMIETSLWDTIFFEIFFCFLNNRKHAYN